MGKSQRSTSTMDVDSQTTTWNICPSFSSTFLDACHDNVHLQHQKPVIGSPPPKGGDYSSLRLEVPNFNPRSGDRENNNYGIGDFSIETKRSSDVIANKDSEINNRRDANAGVDDASELSTRVHELKLQQQQPIIVYENIDDDNDDDSAISLADEEVLTLTVPTIDVSDEKKRPPLSGLISY